MVIVVNRFECNTYIANDFNLTYVTHDNKVADNINYDRNKHLSDSNCVEKNDFDRNFFRIRSSMKTSSNNLNVSQFLFTV